MANKGCLINSFKYALAGFVYCVRKERNIKIHLAAAGASYLLAWYLQLSYQDLIILTLTVTGVLVAEMINTAIEAVVDLVSPQFHPLAKAAKDVAAGAVFLAALASMIVGWLLFVPKL